MVGTAMTAVPRSGLAPGLLRWRCKAIAAGHAQVICGKRLSTREFATLLVVTYATDTQKYSESGDL